MFPFFYEKESTKNVRMVLSRNLIGVNKTIAECKSLYDLVERLQYRLEDMENEHMQLTREIARLQGRLDTLESRLPNED